MAYKKHNWTVGVAPIAAKNLNEMEEQLASPIVGTIEANTLKLKTSTGTTYVESDATNKKLTVSGTFELSGGMAGQFGSTAKGRIVNAVGAKITTLTQAQYDALETKDEFTLYVIVG